ncbi:MAG TPA: hypothetical protein VHN11_21105 [Xanthobacteraceae bacterium]|jgi:hypothetical protein|nr:hypothetical protein [Xanthobacteraceae bacterium]
METHTITITKTVRQLGAANANASTSSISANCSAEEIGGTTNRLLATMVDAQELLKNESL